MIVTSWLFENTMFQIERLEKISTAIGRKNLVVDLSCKRVIDGNIYIYITLLVLRSPNLHSLT